MTDLGIVVNNKARNAEALPAYLDAFEQHKIKYQLYQTEPDQLDEILKKATEVHSVLLVGGGDGTVRSATQHCLHSQTILGVLPLGTLNHFAQELALPATPEALIQAITKNKTTIIDVAQVNDSVFVNNSSIGFYPHFATKRNHYNKFYNKWLSYLPGLWDTLKSHPSFELSIKNAEFNISLRTSFLMISNNLYSYEFPLKFVRTDFNKSELGLYYFKHGTLRISKLIRYFFKRKTSFELKKTTFPLEITIKGIDKVKVSVDGEVLNLNTPLQYQIHSNSLSVLTDSP